MAGTKNRRTRMPSDSVGTVAQVFEKIAAILLRLGFDAPRSEHLLRRAFVSAAKKIVRTSGRRSTQSQIALVAGVNRLDVRRILSSHGHIPKVDANRGQSRVERILTAWREDPEFLNGAGRPRGLTFVGARTQFEKLVRKYGRDVTARTLRENLIKQNLAVADGNRLRLIDQKKSTKVSRSPTLADLNSLRSYLSLFEFEKGRRVSVSRHVALPAGDAKSLRLIQRKSIAKIEVALNSLESLRQVLPTHTKGVRRGKKHRLLITSTLIAESEDGT